MKFEMHIYFIWFPCLFAGRTTDFLNAIDYSNKANKISFLRDSCFFFKTGSLNEKKKKSKSTENTYIFHHAVSVGAVHKIYPERVQSALTNRRRWVSQIIDQLWHHWLHDLVDDIGI